MKAFKLFLFIALIMAGGFSCLQKKSAWKASGIDDIDQIRCEISSVPTNEENAVSRHAALDRWWRLLWRQGYDMSVFDSTACKLVLSRKYDDETMEAINHGYKLLENL